jgi:hypothetical protein
MKIKINDTLTVEAVCTQTATCPSGTAYWRIDYRINGETIYSCSSGPIYGKPSPIEALTWERKIWDATLPGSRYTTPGDFRTGTNRDHLLAAVSQLILDTPAKI